MKTLARVLVTALCLTASPAFSQEETNAVEDIVGILQQKGLIDEATGDEILAKQARSDAKRAAATPAVGAASLVEGLVWNPGHGLGGRAAG